MKEETPGLKKNVFYVGLTSFLTDTSTKLVYSVMPLFLLSIGASKTTISLIEGVAESTASFLKAFSGYWSDRKGKNKPFMIFGYGLTALVTPFYAVAATALQVFGLRFVERIGKGVRTAPRDSLISGSLADRHMGHGFGFHKAMDNSGAIVGPLLAFGLLYMFPLNFHLVFLVAALPAVLGVFTVILLVKETGTGPRPTQKKASLKAIPLKFYHFLAVLFVFTLGNSTDALLLIKSSEMGVPAPYIPFVYMLFNLVSLALAVPLGRWSDRIGRERLILFGFFVYALVYLLFGWSDEALVLVFSFIGYGVYSALTDGTQKALVSDLLGQEAKGTGFGLYHAVLGMTLLPASVIAGYLYDHVDSDAPFYFGATMALLAAVLMMVFMKRYGDFTRPGLVPRQE